MWMWVMEWWISLSSTIAVFPCSFPAPAKDREFASLEICGILIFGFEIRVLVDWKSSTNKVNRL